MFLLNLCRKQKAPNFFFFGQQKQFLSYCALLFMSCFSLPQRFFYTKTAQTFPLLHMLNITKDGKGK